MKGISELLFNLFGISLTATPLRPNLPLRYTSAFSYFKCAKPLPFLFIRPSPDTDPSLIKGVYEQSRYIDAIAVPVFDLSEASPSFIAKAKKAEYPYYKNGKLVLSSPSQKTALPQIETKVAYTKSTQLVAKFYFFAEPKNYTVEDIAQVTKISTSGASRANIALKELGLLQESPGLFPSYRRIAAKAFLEKWMGIYIHPIKEYFYLQRKDLSFLGNVPFLYAGDTAISNETSLSSSDQIEIVLSKKDYAALKANRPEEEDDGTPIAVELYRNDPFLFTKDENIDLADLYFLIKRKYNLDEDPRLEQSLLEIQSRLLHAKS